jgi:hypothetical protein
MYFYYIVRRGLSDSEIEDRISRRRYELRGELQDGPSVHVTTKPEFDSHELAVQIEARNARLADALGVTAVRREEDDPHKLAEEEARKILSTGGNSEEIKPERSRSRSPTDQRTGRTRRRERSRSSSSDSSYSRHSPRHNSRK